MDSPTRQSFVAELVDPALRGRVIALVLAVSAGGTPLIGLVANPLGPRWSLVAGASSGFIAAVVGALALARQRRAQA